MRGERGHNNGMNKNISRHLIMLIIIWRLGEGRVPKLEPKHTRTLQVTKDFVFQSQARRDLTYNPEFVDIVKKVDLQPLAQISGVLEELLDRYNQTCADMEDSNRNESQAEHFVRVPGPKWTVMKGIETCKRWNMKL